LKRILIGCGEVETKLWFLVVYNSSE